MKRKPKRKVKPALVVIPVKDLTYIEEAHKAISKAYRKLKKWYRK